MKSSAIVLVLALILWQAAPAGADDVPAMGGPPAGSATPFTPPPPPPVPGSFEGETGGGAWMPDEAPPAPEAPIVPASPAAVSEASPPPAPGSVRLERACPSPCDLDCCHRWTLFADGGLTYIERAKGPVGLPAGSGSTLPGGGVVPSEFSWNPIKNDVGYAGRLGLSYAAAKCDIVLLQGAAYGIFPEKEDRQTGRVLGFAPGNGLGPNFTMPNDATLSTESQYYGGELHWWHRVACCENLRFHLGVGARYLEFDEKATLDDWAQPFPGFNGLPFLQSEVTNRFLGGQLGVLAEWDAGKRWTFFSSLKALVGSIEYQNDVRDESIFIGGAHSASIQDSKLTYGVDVEFGARWHFSSAWSLRASWNFIFLDKVQRAYEAFDFSQSTTGVVQAQLKTQPLISNTFWLGLEFGF